MQGCRLADWRRHGQAGRDALSPSLVGKPDVLGASRAGGSARRSTTSTAACAAFTPRHVRRRSTSAARGWSSPLEMIIKASLFGARIAEVPITLHPDGRTAHPPHLQDVPRRLAHVCASSCFQSALAVPDAGAPADRRWARSATRSRCRSCASAASRFDVHTLLFASLAIICGYQSIAVRAVDEGIRDQGGLAAGGPAAQSLLQDREARERARGRARVAMVVGLVLLGGAVHQWRAWTSAR